MIALAWTGPVAAQSPAPSSPPPKNNLQVLPGDLKWGELIETMEAFSRALGVHCEHCHVGQEPRFDFAADDKRTKQIARQMMVMTRDLNARVPPIVDKTAGEATQIGCVMTPAARPSAHAWHRVFLSEDPIGTRGGLNAFATRTASRSITSIRWASLTCISGTTEARATPGACIARYFQRQ